MKSAGVALLTGLLAAGAARAEPRSPLCAALDDLAAQVSASGQQADIILLKLDPIGVDCMAGAPDDSLQARFCAAAMDAAGAQFSHRYGWALRSCLGFGPSVSIEENLRAHTGIGKPRIDHMTARLAGGVWLDLRFIPEQGVDGPADPKDPMYGYYGRYRLSLWKP